MVQEQNHRESHMKKGVKLKSNGPRTEPQRKPHEGGSEVEKQFAIFTRWCLSVRYEKTSSEL